jgi:hypothetical protein
MKTGTIVQINARNGMFIIKGDDGEYSAWSLDDSFDLEIGGRIKGHLDALGGETLLNLSSGESFQAVGESAPSSLVAAINAARPN